MEARWMYTQRVMGEVLMRDERPHEIWISMNRYWTR